METKEDANTVSIFNGLAKQMVTSIEMLEKLYGQTTVNRATAKSVSKGNQRSGGTDRYLSVRMMVFFRLLRRLGIVFLGKLRLTSPRIDLISYLDDPSGSGQYLAGDRSSVSDVRLAWIAAFQRVAAGQIDFYQRNLG